MKSRAVIGILATIALPAYQDYTKRAHVSEGLSLAAGAKQSLVEYHADRGVWPTNNGEAGLADKSYIKGNAVTSVEVNGTAAADHGVITVIYNDKVDTAKNTLILHGYVNTDVTQAGSYTWKCSPTDTGTTVLPKWLPARCR